MENKDDSDKGNAEEEEEEAEYEIEAIVGHRKLGNKLQYLIRWAGYTPEDDTWEPIENLQSAKLMCEEYNAKNGLSNSENSEKNEENDEKMIEKSTAAQKIEQIVRMAINPAKSDDDEETKNTENKEKEYKENLVTPAKKPEQTDSSDSDTDDILTEKSAQQKSELEKEKINKLKRAAEERMKRTMNATPQKTRGRKHVQYKIIGVTKKGKKLLYFLSGPKGEIVLSHKEMIRKNVDLLLDFFESHIEFTDRFEFKL